MKNWDGVRNVPNAGDDTLDLGTHGQFWKENCMKVKMEETGRRQRLSKT